MFNWLRQSSSPTQCRFPATAGAHNAEELPGADIQINPGQRLHGTIPHRELLSQVADADLR